MSTELFLAVDNNPQDVKAFENLVKACTAADDRDTLEEVYKNVPRWAPDSAQNHMVRVLSQYARTATNPALQSWLNYKNGLLFWQTYRDQQMAEMAFRKANSCWIPGRCRWSVLARPASRTGSDGSRTRPVATAAGRTDGSRRRPCARCSR